MRIGLLGQGAVSAQEMAGAAADSSAAASRPRRMAFMIVTPF
jgi:hypothetical protein